jgi:uncharacterized protein
MDKLFNSRSLDFMAGKFEWFVSTEILLEYEEILTDTYSQNTAHLVLNQLVIAPNVVFTEPAFRMEILIFLKTSYSLYSK